MSEGVHIEVNNIIFQVNENMTNATLMTILLICRVCLGEIGFSFENSRTGFGKDCIFFFFLDFFGKFLIIIICF